MNKLLKWAVIFVAVFGVLSITVIVLANNKYAPEYEVIEQTDYEDSHHVRVETNQTSKEELEVIVKDVEEKYKGVDAVWLWIFKEGEEDLLAKAKIPYNHKGEIMVGEDELWIEYEQ